MKRKSLLTLMLASIALAETEKIDPELRHAGRLNKKAAAEEVDVIVQYADSASREAVRERSAVWGSLKPQIEHLPFEFMRVKRRDLETMAADPDIVYVSPDRDLGATHFPPWMRNEANRLPVCRHDGAGAADTLGRWGWHRDHRQWRVGG